MYRVARFEITDDPSVIVDPTHPDFKKYVRTKGPNSVTMHWDSE